jgi:hypothetical protein
MTAAEWMAPWAPPSSAAYAAAPAAQQGCQGYPSGMALQQVDYCNGMQYYSQDASAAAYAASALVGSAGAARASLVRSFARASGC